MILYNSLGWGGPPISKISCIIPSTMILIQDNLQKISLFTLQKWNFFHARVSTIAVKWIQIANIMWRVLRQLLSKHHSQVYIHTYYKVGRLFSSIELYKFYSTHYSEYELFSKWTFSWMDCLLLIIAIYKMQQQNKKPAP